MPRREAKNAIEELNDELRRTPKETSALERILEQAGDEIEEYTPEAVKELIETLSSESKDFELEHPRITAMINQVVNTLVGLGI